MENLNQTFPVQIESIPLSDTNYGRSLNERFDSINANFESIISRDYLKGNDGANVGVEPWQIDINTSDTTKKSYINEIIDAICSLDIDKDSIKSEQSSSIKNQLNGKIVYLVKDSTGQLLSSLPFTYIDFRYASSSSVRDEGLKDAFENTRDLSCIICYDNGFKAVQSFPTIYWDSSLTTGDNDGGDLCWMINGEKTGLPCRGPQGANGLSGRLYTAFYNIEPLEGTTNVFPIVAVLNTVRNDNSYENTYVYANDFSNNKIDIKTGDTVIGIPCRISVDSDGKYIEVATNQTNTGAGTIVGDQETLMTNYTISTVYCDESKSNYDEKYLLVSDGKSVEIPLILQDALLSNLLKNNDLLYVPARKNGQIVETGHAIWSDPTNDKNMCLGTIKNPASVDHNLYDPDGDSPVTVKSRIFNVGIDDQLQTSIDSSDNMVTVTQTATFGSAQTINVPKFYAINLDRLPMWTINSNIGVFTFNSYNYLSIYNNFGSCQFVYLNNEDTGYYTAVKLTGSNDQFFIRWRDFNAFSKTILDIREMMMENSAPDLTIDVEIGTFNRLRVDDLNNMWVADSFNAIYSDRITFQKEFWNDPDSLAIQKLTNIKLSSDGNFTYIFNSYNNSNNIVESPILLDFKDYNQATQLPVFGTLTHREYLYLVTEIVENESEISVSNIRVDDVENQNEILPIPKIRTKKYTNPNFKSGISEEFNVYNGKFDTYTTTVNSRENYSQIQLDSASEMIVDESQIIKHKCVTLYDSINIAKRSSGDTWADNSTNLCSFQADLINLSFTIKDYEGVTADMYIPILDMGPNSISNGTLRFRSVYKLNKSNILPRPLVNYLIIGANNLSNLYAFFTSYINTQDYNLVPLNGVTAAVTEQIDEPISQTLSNDSLRKNNKPSIHATFDRDYHIEFDTVYAWAQTIQVPDGVGTQLTRLPRPVIFSQMPSFSNYNEYILCKTYDKNDSELRAPDDHVYSLMKVVRRTAKYNDIIEKITDETHDAGYIQNTYSLDDPSLFERACVVENNLYKSDNSIDQLRIDKIERFCNSLEINGENILLMIQELKALALRVSELDNRIKELEK